MNLNLFFEYNNEKLIIGGEYLYQFNNNFIDKQDFHGYSIFSSLKVTPKWKPFIRYDYMKFTSENNIPWNKTDRSFALAGIQYQPIKQFKIAVNFRNHNYKGKEAEQFIFLNAEFNL